MIRLDAHLVPNSDQVMLSWQDNNLIGDNRYQIERSINGAEYEKTLLRPHSNQSIQDTIKPDWFGKKIVYKVYERFGSQKLLSDMAAVVIPDALEPPTNLRYTTSYEEGVGHIVTTSWDHAPFFRNYIIQQHIDDEWIRIDKTNMNYINMHLQPGEHPFRIASHINGIISTPAEIVASVYTE